MSSGPTFAEFDFRDFDVVNRIKVSGNWTILLIFRRNPEYVIKPADKGEATVDLYLQEGYRQLAGTNTSLQLTEDPTAGDPAFPRYYHGQEFHQKQWTHLVCHWAYTGRSPLCSVLFPKIPKSSGRPIVSTCNCPAALIIQHLDRVLSPMVACLSSYFKDTTDAIWTFNRFDSLVNVVTYLLWVSLWFKLPWMMGLWLPSTFLVSTTLSAALPLVLCDWLS